MSRAPGRGPYLGYLAGIATETAWTLFLFALSVIIILVLGWLVK